MADKMGPEELRAKCRYNLTTTFAIELLRISPYDHLQVPSEVADQAVALADAILLKLGILGK